MSVTSAQDALRLSVETQESAVDAVRAAFGSWVFPAVSLDVWKWWYGSGIGMLSGYAEMITRTPASGTRDVGVPTAVPTEVDVTDARADGIQTTQRAAAADASSARVTASARRKVT
jgi:hypothetical protein